MEYMLHVWGGIYNKDSEIPKDLRKYDGYTYFSTKDEMDIVISELEKYSNLGLVIDIKEGELTHKSTIACMVFEYKNKEYYLEYDFGYEYSKESALFMFEEGNYSCDCNRALFLADEYEEFDLGDDYEWECGDEIELKHIEIEYR